MLFHGSGNPFFSSCHTVAFVGGKIKRESECLLGTADDKLSAGSEIWTRGHEGLSCVLTREAVESEVTGMDLKMYACAVAQSRALDAVLLEVE